MVRFLLVFALNQIITRLFQIFETADIEEVTYSETQIQRHWTNDDVKECKCSMNLINLNEHVSL
jgi:hypothetical protein